LVCQFGELEEDPRLRLGSVPKVVEKHNGISYPMERRKINWGLLQTPRKGGYTDGERVPQRTWVDHSRPGTILGGTV
jgi:hypothetical protein